MTLYRKMPRAIMLASIFAVSLLLTCPSISMASETDEVAERLRQGVEEVERADWNHRWTGYGIALAGGSIGLGMGGWALHRRPLERAGRADPIIFSSSLLLVGASFSQYIHAGMRLDERIQSAKTARRLLKSNAALNTNGMFFLNHRAESAISTRLWGGIMTTAQGLATTGLGARLWQKGDGGLQTTGIALTAMGLVNVGIGAIHFFGNPRSVRIRDRVLGSSVHKSRQNFHLRATVSPNGNLVPSLGLSGAL